MVNLITKDGIPERLESLYERVEIVIKHSRYVCVKDP